MRSDLPAEDGGLLDEVGVVVLTYGSGPPEFSLPADLRDAGLPAGHVINPHNPDGGPSQLPVPEGWRRVASTSNVGYAAAINRALRMHLSEGRRYVMVLTHDVRLPPGSLALMFEAARAHPRYAVLGPALVRSDNGTVYSRGGIARANGTFGHRGPQGGATDSGVISVDWIDGCAMLLKADALMTEGLFDERFFLYFEDSEICVRMRRAQWQCGIVSAATVETAPGGVRRAVAYQYFFSRNGLECALLSGGRQVALRALLGRLRLAVILSARAGVRRTARRGASGGPTFQEAGACLSGILHWSTRRWGPPPPWIVRASDIRGLSPRARWAFPGFRSRPLSAG